MSPPANLLTLDNGLHLMPVAALKDNYVWLLMDGTRTALIVDPGDATPVLAAMQREDIRLGAILLTHHHLDHIGGVADLLATATVPVYAPSDARIDVPHQTVIDGERIDIKDPSFALDVIAVPGHTRSHVAYHGHGVLFSGDTLFSVGCGRMFEGDAEQMLSSLDRLASLPAKTRVCCGHEYTVANCAFAREIEPGNAALAARETAAREMRAINKATVPSTLESELACNPFLRVDTAQIAARFEPDGDRIARFALLRSMKDAWQAPAT